jgi:hypothetical protein
LGKIKRLKYLVIRYPHRAFFNTGELPAARPFSIEVIYERAKERKTAPTDDLQCASIGWHGSAPRPVLSAVIRAVAMP